LPPQGTAGTGTGTFAAISVEKKKTAIGLWRLATGDSYRSCGLMFGIAKSTANGALYQLKKKIIKK